MVSQPIAMALLSPVAGKLSDRINPGIISATGIALTTIGLTLLYFINEHTQIPHLVAILVLMGTGFGLFATPNTNAIMSSVDRKFLGTASGVVGTMRTIGQMTSMSIAMMLLAYHVGKEPISQATLPGLLLAIRTGFLTLAILSVFALCASLVRNKRQDTT